MDGLIRMLGWCLGSESEDETWRALQRSARDLSGIGCAIMTGCGGGGSAPPAPCVPQAVVLQIEGDSISLGVGGTDPSTAPAALLKAAFPAATVVATGLSGSTTSDRINGTVILGQGTAFQPFPAGVVGDIYLTEWGVNDARYAIPIETYKANLRKIASVPGAVLMTPTPMDTTKAIAADDSSYAQAVRDVGKELGVPVIDVNAYVLSVPNWQLLLVDGVHPSDALYRSIYGSVVVPAVTPLVARLKCQ